MSQSGPRSILTADLSEVSPELCPGSHPLSGLQRPTLVSLFQLADTGTHKSSADIVELKYTRAGAHTHIHTHFYVYYTTTVLGTWGSGSNQVKKFRNVFKSQCSDEIRNTEMASSFGENIRGSGMWLSWLTWMIQSRLYPARFLVIGFLLVKGRCVRVGAVGGDSLHGVKMALRPLARRWWRWDGDWDSDDWNGPVAPGAQGLSAGPTGNQNQCCDDAAAWILYTEMYDPKETKCLAIQLSPLKTELQRILNFLTSRSDVFLLCPRESLYVFLPLSWKVTASKRNLPTSSAVEVCRVAVLNSRARSSGRRDVKRLRCEGLFVFSILTRKLLLSNLQTASFTSDICMYKTFAIFKCRFHCCVNIAINYWYKNARNIGMTRKCLLVHQMFVCLL